MVQDKVRLTKAAIEALQCPTGQARIYVYDSMASGLCLRVGRGGRKVFVWSGRKAGRPTRITLGTYPATTIERARLLAHEAAAQANMEAHPLASERKRHTIEEAFAEALAASKRGERARDDWKRATGAFLQWLAKRYPAAKHWDDLNRRIVKEYMATRAGVSATRRRLDLQPIAQASRYMHLEHEAPFFATSLGIGSKLEKPPAAVYLSDVAHFLDFLRERYPWLEAGAALQGLAGLQLLEALRLSWGKVDLERGLVEISGEVKNLYRNRVIPIPQRALEALKRAQEARPWRKVQPMAGERVVLSALGFPFEGKSEMNYAKRIKRALLEWNPQCSWAAKDLRNALPTFAAQSGVLCLAWEAYLGHAARGVTGRHYVPRLASGTLGEGEALDKQMEVFRRLVVGPLEAALVRGAAAILETSGA